MRQLLQQRVEKRIEATGGHLHSSLYRIDEQSDPFMVLTPFKTLQILSKAQRSDNVEGAVAIPLLQVNRLTVSDQQV